MPNPTFRRWTADEIAMLKNMAKSVAPSLGNGTLLDRSTLL